MSSEDNSIGRREVLQKSAAAGAGSFGLLSAADVSAAGPGDKLTAMEQMGVVLTEKRVRAHSDTVIPAEVRTGERLLERLEADGLLESASLDALPALNASGTGPGQTHLLTGDGNPEIAFTKMTSEGKLQVSFSRNAVPTASLSPTDGGSVELYVSPDGQTYERIESDLTTSDSDFTTQSCSDSCGGCVCTNNWCVGIEDPFHSAHCQNCIDGECVQTTKCGCN